MTTKKEFENLKYLMFGIITGGGFSLFGSVAVGAYFADPNAEGRMFLLAYGTVFLLITFALSFSLYYYFNKKSK